MWEHNEGSSIWSYVVNGIVVGDVIENEASFESHIYGEDDSMTITDVCGSLTDAKKFVESMVGFESKFEISEVSEGNDLQKRWRGSSKNQHPKMRAIRNRRSLF